MYRNRLEIYLRHCFPGCDRSGRHSAYAGPPVLATLGGLLASGFLGPSEAPVDGAAFRPRSRLSLNVADGIHYSLSIQSESPSFNARWTRA
jgi:hypothetical protein